MDRRGFFKIAGTASGAALTGACGKQAEELIPILVPVEQIVPGVEEFRPSVCRECAAGCGTIVRVMAAEREVERDGKEFRQKIAAVKKIEGNPADPVSGGRLCARGQAAVQRLYHPDRVQGPLKRVGARGEGRFESLSWDEALDQVSSRLEQFDPAKIAYLSSSGTGTRAVNTARFLSALGAPSAVSLGGASASPDTPLYAVDQADYILSIGADFLGGWVSPVLYARQFGHFRRGRQSIRGMLVHAESRSSQTAWAADRWLPVKPGAEAAFAVLVESVLDLRELNREDAALSQRIAELAATCGLARDKVERVCDELARARAPLVLAGGSEGGALLAQAASRLNARLGATSLVSRSAVIEPFSDARPSVTTGDQAIEQAEALFLDGADLAYLAPRTAAALGEMDLVVSFAGILDDSAAYADFVLPDADALESSFAVMPAALAAPGLAAVEAAVKPMYDVRSTDEVLAQIAKRRGNGFSPMTAAQALAAVTDDAASSLAAGGFWQKGAPATDDPAIAAQPGEEPEPQPVLEFVALTITLSGDYPLQFQAYPSAGFGFGDGAALPWLQEMPDPGTSAMWSAPLEIDRATAEQLGLVNGDLVRATSALGSIEAPVYVHPAAIPGVASMAIGQGHRALGRYARDRGANPLVLVADVALPRAAIRIERLSGGERLLQYSSVDRHDHLVRL